MGNKVEMAKLLTFTLLFVTLALAAVADPDEVAPYDSDDEPRMDDSVSLGLDDDGDAAEVSALDRTDETELGLGDDSLDEDGFDDDAADDLDRAVDTELQTNPSDDSDRRSPVRCASGYKNQRICRPRRGACFRGR